MAQQLNTCYHWQQIWEYINNHQDDTYLQIAVEIGITEEDCKTLSMCWALGDKKEFEQEFDKMKTTY